MNDDDFACLALLECAEAWANLPLECKESTLEAEGLIERLAVGWRLTDLGRLRLRTLRAIAASATRRKDLA